ncbi:MAG: O-antigen ligase family protein [Armatimonadota bacterium]
MPRARARSTSGQRSSSEAQRGTSGSPMLFEWLTAALVILPLAGGKPTVAGDTPPAGPAALWFWFRAFPPEACLTAMSLASLVVWAVSTLRRGQSHTGYRPHAHIPAVLFCLLALASLGWTLSLHSTLHETARHAAQVLFFLLAVQMVGHGRSHVLAWGVVASAGLQGLLALREYAAACLAGDPTWRAFGTLPNPNVLASFLLTALPVSVTLCVRMPRPLQVLAGGAVLVQFAGLMLTGSRGGWLAAGVGLLCWLVFSARHMNREAWRRLAVLGLLCAVVIPLASIPLRSRVVGAGAPSQGDSSKFRVLTWLGTLDAIRERPLLGAGAGTFEVLYPPHARAGFTRMAHNSYLQIAAELGIVGLALWLWTIGTVLWTGLRGQDTPQGPALRAAGAAGLLGTAAHNLVDYGWYIPATAGLFWACMALAGGVRSPVQGGRRRAVLLFSMAGLGMISSVLLPLGVGDLLCVGAEHRPTPHEKLAAYRAALRWNPIDPECRSDYAAVLAWAGRPDLALQEFRRLTEQEPNRANMRYRYALALQRSGMVEQALAQYERSIQLDPTATTPLIAAANLYLALGRVDRAELLYRRAASLEDSPVGTVKALEDFGDPNYAEAHLALAQILAGRGDIRGSKREAQEGLRSADAALSGLTRWRKIQQAVGRYDDAKERHLLHVKQKLMQIAGLAHP